MSYLQDFLGHHGRHSKYQNAYDLGFILDLHPQNGITCVGYAPSQGRRCQNPINKNNRAVASSRLIISGTCSHEQLFVELETLAERLCCWRHGNQAGGITQQWMTLVKDYSKRNPPVYNYGERVLSTPVSKNFEPDRNTLKIYRDPAVPKMTPQETKDSWVMTTAPVLGRKSTNQDMTVRTAVVTSQVNQKDIGVIVKTEADKVQSVTKVNKVASQTIETDKQRAIIERAAQEKRQHVSLSTCSIPCSQDL
jgi:hypothetical protein